MARQRLLSANLGDGHDVESPSGCLTAYTAKTSANFSKTTTRTMTRISRRRRTVELGSGCNEGSETRIGSEQVALISTGATSSVSTIRIMRPLFIGLLVGLGLLTLLAFAAHNQQESSKFKPSHQRELAEELGVEFLDSDDDVTTNENDLPPSNSNAPNPSSRRDQADKNKSWFCNMLGPMAELLGYKRKADEQNLIKFEKVAQGYLNQRNHRDHYPHQERSTSAASISRAQSPAQAKAESETKQLISGAQAFRRGEFVGVRKIDKIRGIDDLPSLSYSADESGNRMSREEAEGEEKEGEERREGRRQSRSGQGSLLPAGQQQWRKSAAKCQLGDHDRLIAEKMSKNELSKPVINSDGRFENPFPTWSKPSMTDLFMFMVEASEANVPKNRDELEKELPLIKPNFVEFLQTNKQPGVKADDKQSDFKVTWIGHSTLLIQVDGLNILTDPIFSERASPSQMFGPKRIREPACNVEALPPIHIVLISHNHYDHLDANSVKSINDRFGIKCRWIVPLGLGEFLESMSVRNYVELDWWQKDCFQLNEGEGDDKSNRSAPQGVSLISNKFGLESREQVGEELDIYLTPSQHWSRRGVNDINKSLWGSYTIVSSKKATFFFGGDTGYCDAFKEIATIFAPFTGAAIPIGAYKPRWFLKAQHVDPNEAALIHKELRSSKSIAIHHSTFMLSNEYYKEPSNLLREIMRSQQIKEPFLVLKHGETSEFYRQQITNNL